MTHDNLFPLILRLVTSLPKRPEQLLLLAEVWLLVAKEDLQTAWRNHEFKEAQTRQLTMLDRMRDCTSREAELEQAQPGTEIEQAGWMELEQLEKKIRSKLAGA